MYNIVRITTICICIKILVLVKVSKQFFYKILSSILTCRIQAMVDI